MVNETPQVMTIAGTDSSGGAGMTADLNTFAAHGIYSANDMVMAQLQSVADDLAIRAVKTGMLGDAATVKTVAQGLQQFNFGPLILDPVMVAKGGAQLLSDEAVATVRTTLMPLATLITPNIPEAEVLTGLAIQSPSDIMAAADRLHSFGTKNILIKGGHGNARVVTDYVRLENGEHFWLQTTRFDTPRTHGTGDTISAAITAQLGLGVTLKTAIMHAKAYVDATIRDGIAVGHGHGPLNHFPKVTAENQPEVYDEI